MEEKRMNEHILAGQWRQMRGAVKSWWGRLTDDDFDRIGGEKDKLIGVIQEKYGRTREQALQEVEQRLSEYDTGGSTAASDWSRTASNAESAGYDWRETAGERARQAVSAVGDKLDSVTSYFKENEFRSMADDFTDLLRKHPIQSLLIGIGVGYLLARSTRHS
jgi:uncharacterized protein YjbJ (UPF0337 family)